MCCANESNQTTILLEQFKEGTAWMQQQIEEEDQSFRRNLAMSVINTCILCYLFVCITLVKGQNLRQHLDQLRAAVAVKPG